MNLIYLFEMLKGKSLHVVYNYIFLARINNLLYNFQHFVFFGENFNK